MLTTFRWRHNLWKSVFLGSKSKQNRYIISKFFRWWSRDLVADNEKGLAAITLGTGFGGITDIETGPDGSLYIFTFDQESDGDGGIIQNRFSKFVKRGFAQVLLIPF